MAMVANLSSTNQNPTVNGRIDYPNKHCSTEEPLFPAISSKDLYPLDQSSCSSQQEPMFEKYNPRNNMDSPSGSNLKPCNADFKKTLRKKQKVDLSTNCNEITQDNLKSPIAKLNEIMLSKRQVVEYKLISVTGQIHNPVFKFTVINNEMQAYGEGFSKKEAKKNAAIAFLDKLGINDENNTITSTTSNISPSKVNPLKYSEESIVDEISKINPIGVLQEVCMARHWELPDYKFLQNEYIESGDNAWYSVVCSLRDYQSKGKGKTKQAAKRQAAHIMYDQIKNVSQQTFSKAREFVYPVPSNSMLDAMEINDLDCLNNLKSLEIIFNQLKSSQNPSLSKLRNIDSTIEIRKNAITLLNAVGEEENFNMTYKWSKKIGEIGVIVQLAITPLLVFIGNGKSIAEAQEMAAFVALSYIKLLLEK